jgi:hypothetical protein
MALCCGAFGATAGVDDVIKLQRSAVGDDVLIAFVQDSTVAYDLTAEDIQRLDDANVPSTVIVAMLDHGKQLRSAPADLPLPPASPAVTVAPASSPTAVVYAPAPEQANITLFYEALSPYGTWSQDEGNGWVWEPSDGMRDTSWRPYANDGHWTWTDHGWYWESESPYGWATYHYGRWGYNSHHRWSWAPDNVWGPAWVDWRQSDDYYGWAPLPFGSRFEVGVGFSFGGRNRGFDFHADLDESYYSFVPSGNFLDINLGLVLERNDRRRHDFYGRTRVVNNTYVYNDNRIINNGVPVASVQRATNRKIERVAVVDANIAVGQPIRGERHTANRIEAYRPKLANVAPVEPPVMVARQKAAALHASVAVKAEDRKTVAVDRQADRQAASRRVEETKALLKDKQTSSALDRKATVETNRAAKVDASFEKQHEREEAAKERKTSAEEKQQANEKVREAKAEAKVREKTSEQPSKSEAQPRSTNNEAAAERGAANREAAAERKAATESNREVKQNTAKEKQSATNEAAAERSAANKEAAAERSSANREAAVEHKAAAETNREAKQSAAEEKRSANKEAAAERKDAAADEKDNKREERGAAKDEKAHERK